MITRNFNVTKLINSLYKDTIQKEDGGIIYCEIQYQRDISSFAGAALKINNEKNVIKVKYCEEKLVRSVNRYEKIYTGCEQYYINSIKDIFSLKEREYGIEVFFLVYSNIRSSQIIFEELMKNVDRNIDTIRDKF